MTGSQIIDTYVICYGKPSNLWAAFSTKTHQVGMGSNPKEALANGISAADQAVESGNDQINNQGLNCSHQLLLSLARVAQSLPEGEFAQGVVYKYERTWSPISPPA